ncbi:MAG TPA: molybdopterin-guanine dinucleotide biosynthesis protein B [Devosia sp.]|nr:molybdopterin-guanine dinucleotide biosynthesis protein B [Devosia sp.]
MSAVVGIVGWKNSGKTTLIIKLVLEFTARGYSVSTIKHAHHHADIDHPGTDSYRHRQAGANEVVLVTAERWALMHEVRETAEPSVHEVLARLAPVDLVIVEGFKQDPIPKIEVRRCQTAERKPLADDPHVIAVASDTPTGINGLFLNLDDVGAIADFIAAYFNLRIPR